MTTRRMAAGREIGADDVADKILPRLASRSLSGRHTLENLHVTGQLGRPALHERARASNPAHGSRCMMGRTSMVPILAIGILAAI